MRCLEPFYMLGISKKRKIIHPGVLCYYVKKTYKKTRS